MKSLQAEIIAAALHISRRELFGKNALEKWNVFLHQLFLQVFGAGGNNYTTRAACCSGDSRNQISESFAGPGAGFDDEVIFIFERTHDGIRHLNLAGPIFELRMRLSDESLRAEDFLHGLIVLSASPAVANSHSSSGRLW